MFITVRALNNTVLNDGGVFEAFTCQSTSGINLHESTSNDECKYPRRFIGHCHLFYNVIVIIDGVKALIPVLHAKIANESFKKKARESDLVYGAVELGVKLFGRTASLYPSDCN